MQASRHPAADPRLCAPSTDGASERARTALRHQLRQATPFPPGAIDRLVRYSEFTTVARNDEICASDARVRSVRFTMHGVAKLACRLSGGREQVVRYLAARKFVCIPLANIARGYRAAVVAHEETHVALLRYEDFQEAFSTLGPATARVHSWAFRERMQHFCDVAALLPMPLRERLVWCLRHLAAELPEPGYEGPGISIATRITRQDLADLAGASRPATCRAMALFDAAGLVLPSPATRIVVAPSLMQTDVRCLMAILATKEMSA